MLNSLRKALKQGRTNASERALCFIYISNGGPLSLLPVWPSINRCHVYRCQSQVLRQFRGKALIRLFDYSPPYTVGQPLNEIYHQKPFGCTTAALRVG